MEYGPNLVLKHFNNQHLSYIAHTDRRIDAMENAVGEGRRVYGLVDKKATDINYTLQHSLGQRILEITNRLYTVLKLSLIHI